MAEKILELFGYARDDASAEATAARAGESCPFIGGQCAKQIGSAANRIRSGVCSISSKDGVPVVICPIRLYADQYALLSTVAKLAFKVDAVTLVDGRRAAGANCAADSQLVAVFGKGWGGELRVPGRPLSDRKSSGFLSTGFWHGWMRTRTCLNSQRWRCRRWTPSAVTVPNAKRF